MKSSRIIAEADAERLRRELRGEREELRLAISKETELQIERDRLDAVLGKVGANALDELEARLEGSEDRRWQADAEIEKLRAELSWQTNSRMDERSVVSQLEEELTKESQAKRRIQVRHTQLEENLEKSMAALRARRRESNDFRKRIDALLNKGGMAGGVGMTGNYGSGSGRGGANNYTSGRRANVPSLPTRPKVVDEPVGRRRVGGRGNGSGVGYVEPNAMGGVKKKTARRNRSIGRRTKTGGVDYDEPSRGRFGI